MKMLKSFSLILLSILLFGLVACDKDEPEKDKIETIKLFVAAEVTPHYIWGHPILGIQIKEEGETKFHTIAMNGIIDFEYEEGYEYELRVVKKTLANPPYDGNNIEYRLLEILSKTKVDIPEVKITEQDIKYKEGCPYELYTVYNPTIFVTADGDFIDSDNDQGAGYDYKNIYLEYNQKDGDKYFNELLYMPTSVYVIDPFPMKNPSKYLRFAPIRNKSLALKNMMTKEAADYLINEAPKDTTLTYQFILMNAEELGLQKLKVTFIKH